MENRYTFIDLFSGAGGFLRGFFDAGFEAALSVEMWEPAIQSHKNNFPDVPLMAEDIRGISTDFLQKFKYKIDVIIGGPPCQGFSTIGRRLKKDPRNELVFEFIRFVKAIKPRVFLMENVRGLLSSDNGVTRDAICKEFEAIGYQQVHCKVLCAADFGVPQMRYRVFFMGVRSDLFESIRLPDGKIAKENYSTVGEVINDLLGKENQVANHVPMKHNKIVSERISFIPEGEGLPDMGMPEHLLRGSRRDFLNNNIKNFSHVYKRLHRKRPATTMVPGHNAFPLHPTENRSLTVREAARIQTFPDDMTFMGNRQNQCIQVGNAVPVKLAFELAVHIKDFLEEVDK